MAFNPCTMEPWGFPDDSDGNESACNAGDLGSLLALGRSPGEGNGNPLQYSWLENSVDRSYGPWVCKESDTTERLTHSRCGAPGLWACFLAATEGGWDSHPTSPREFHLCHLLDSHVEFFFFFKEGEGFQYLKKWHKDLPGVPVVKNPPSNAGDTGSIPGWWTKISYALRQLSPHTTTTEPECLNDDPSCSCACIPQLFLMQPKINK